MSGTITLEDITRNARSANKEVLRETARQFLTDVELMKQANNMRWSLAEHLFPHFVLPTGWLKVALEGKLEKQEVAHLISTRLRAITDEKAAEAESDFLRVLIVEEPATMRLAYRRVLKGPHLDEVLRVAKLLSESNGPDTVRRIHLAVVARNRE